LFQDQDQDFRNFLRSGPRPSLFGQDQDQDLHTVSDNLAKDSYKQCTWLNKVMWWNQHQHNSNVSTI